MKLHCAFILSILFGTAVSGQSYCDYKDKETLSSRLANYVMEVDLNYDEKKVLGTQQIEWINNGPDQVQHVEMYMYLNSFKGITSSYIAGSVNNVMGQDLQDRPQEDWGYVELESVTLSDKEQELERYYIHNLDDNKKDQSVIKIELPEPVLPGDTLHLSTKFISKLPRTIARVGFAENNFHFFVHWYPKLGVYESNEAGEWGWNCHQFLQRMEFYGEFGTYDMTIRTDESMKVGASGCRIDVSDIGDGMTEHRFIANDVIDFAWVSYPDFEIYEDNWNGVDIEIFYPAHHKNLLHRLVGAVKNSLAYLEEHVGPYPYPKITVMDPPALGMRSGFMEYPTFITGGSFYGFPSGVKTLESLIVHEFGHQYFMGMMANNEKEAPWLDEGFVTFFEDNIMEANYGSESSLFDFFGYKVANSEKSRNEYITLNDLRVSQITKKSWKIKGGYKGIIYAKTSMILRSLNRVMGDQTFYSMIKSYFDKHKFSHPRQSDFLNKVREYSTGLGALQKKQVEALITQGLDSTAICDFAIGDVVIQDLGKSYQSTVTILQKEDFKIPVEVLFEFEDGSNKVNVWSGETRSEQFVLSGPSPIKSVYIDPQQKLFIDINFNNNSYTVESSNMTMVKYLSRSIYWAQNALQSLSFLM